MGGRLFGGSSRKLALLFVAVAVPPAVTLVWLGLQLLEQDRSLWAQRELERRQATAESVIHSLEQSLAQLQGRTEDPLPEGVVRFTLSKLGIKAEPPGRVLWLPVAAHLEQAETRPFDDAEKVEFRGGSERALLAYRRMARSPKPALRAGALLRVARVHRRARRWDDALAAYRQLAQSKHIGINDMPADLLARRAMCSVLMRCGRKKELAEEVTSLEADFVAGRWTLDQPAWELTARQLEQWAGHDMLLSAEQQAFSEVADRIWEEWQRSPADRFPASNRALIVDEQTLLWRTGAETLVTAISPSVLQTWLARAVQDGPTMGDRLSLLSGTGRLLAGSQPPSGPAVVKASASETGLPWTLVVSPGDSSGQAQELAGRRRLLSLGLVAIVLLLGGGSYFLWRVIHRELAVARLQTDFVSAVSHEFRTPLASLRHVTELMQEDDNLPPERRRTFYQSLGRNTERLHRLVESLLDFARMEGKRKPYDLQPLDAGELAAKVVADFRKEVGPGGFTVDLDVENSGALSVRADAASLTNALWNLLDNAAKYSAEGRTICVSVRRHPAGVAIAVRDNGLGIPRREQKEIFGRFVRGEEASRLGIKGTGLGLAMVSRIVRAHGGSIELESEEGAGTTFRLVLPAHG